MNQAQKPEKFVFFFLLLILLLAGCGFQSSQGNAATITPLALSPTATTTISSASASDWTTYHQNNNRNGYVANAPDPTRLTPAWNKQLDGAVYAEPLVVGGRVIVATENDTLYAFDSQTGRQLWRTNVGQAVPQSTLPCGDIDPLGITGTPVYDPATGLIFAVAEITGPSHLLVGIDITSGQVKVRRSADIAGMDATAYQERGALALSHGMIYVPFGGLAGDCSNYRGTVIASRTDGTGPLLSFRVPTPREGGIWTPPGPAVDSQGNLFVAVGNGEKTSGAWDHSDSILRLSPTLTLEDGFAPVHWGDENSRDADLGSMGPILLENKWIYTDGKAGTGYLLHANHLGGVGGQVASIDLCAAYGGSAAIGTQVFVPCSTGLASITISEDGHITRGWHAPSNIQGSPIVGGHTVYALDPGGQLYALNSATGAVRAQMSVGASSRFATPTLVNNMVFVGTLTGIVSARLA